jgi:hypothetical protein
MQPHRVAGNATPATARMDDNPDPTLYYTPEVLQKLAAGTGRVRRSCAHINTESCMQGPCERELYG